MIFKVIKLFYAFCGGMLFAEGLCSDHPACIFIGCIAGLAACVLEVIGV